MIKNSKQLAMVMALSMMGCSHMAGHRIPSSLENKTDLKDVISSLADAVGNPVESSIQCHQGLRSYYGVLLGMTSDKINMNSLKGEQLDDIIETSFATRLEIKEKLRQLNVKTLDDQKCLAAVRDTTRALRYVEDYLTEMKVVDKDNREKDEIPSLEGEAPYFLLNPKFEGVFKNYHDLKSGDVILSRGNAYSSAAIARIGTTDAQFSHLTLVYRNEKNELHTIEAHIEIGNVVAPIQHHLDGHNSREVVFRFKDSALAHQAAKYMYEKVQARQKKKKNIRYDFGMDYKDNSKLFCSEVIYDGYRHASGGELDIPVYKTKFHPGLIPFLNNIGIKVTKENIDSFDTFSPGDIEFDPRFELVAEWRNPKKIGDSRIKDVILTKLFEWMENENYRFYPKGKYKRQAAFGWLMRRVPWLNKKMGLTKQFPLNMSTKQIRFFMTLDDVGEALYSHLEKIQKSKKHPLTPIEMFEALEKFRKEDLAVYEKHKRRSKFHRQFHRPGVKKKNNKKHFGPRYRH